jgi:hypothetical protein
VSDDVRKDRSWPTNAKRLITHLKRIAPQLRRAGVDFVRTGERVEAGYLIMLMPRGASAADAAPDAADSADEVPF